MEDLLMDIIIIVLFIILDDSSYNGLRSHHYFSRSPMQFNYLINDDYTFQNIFKMTPELFLTQIVIPCYKWQKLPRNTDLTLYENALEYTGNMRSTQINNCDRILRLMLRLQGVSSKVVAWCFDQHPSTVSRDVPHTAAVVCKALVSIISPIMINSDEYTEKKGKKGFKSFPNALYAIDCTHVCCFNHKLNGTTAQIYYDGHKHRHCISFLVGCDCDGLARFIHGHEPGSTNDIQCYYNSCLSNAITNNILTTDDRVLADGIFARIKGPFITPVCYLQRTFTRKEKKYNIVQRHARAIIEHYFGRLKVTYGLLGTIFNLNISCADIMVRSACIFTNIIIKYLHPLK